MSQKERRMARIASLESDFRGFFQISSDLMLIADANANVADLNTAWLTTLGWSHDELVGTSVFNLIHPDDLASTMLEYQVLMDGSKETIVVHETRIRCKDGAYRWTDWTAGMMGDTLYAIGRDITDRKTTLATLAESLETTRAISDAALDSIVVIDRDLNIVETNASSEEIHGHSSTVRRNHNVLDLIHPDDRENIKRTLLRSFEDGGVAILNFRIRHADGHYVALEARGRSLRSDDGVPTRLVFIGRDATEANAARAALTESLELSRAIFDAAVDGIVMMDRNFHIVESNAAVAHMLGVTSDREANQVAMTFIHPDDVAAVRDAAKRLFTSDEIVTVRYRAQHADGHWVKIESRGRGLFNPQGPTNVAVFIARDISKTVENEEALAASLETTRAIFDAAADGIVMVNRDFQVVESNLASASLFGSTADQRSGLASLDDVHPDDLGLVLEAGQRMFDSDEIVTARYRVLRGGGEVATIESRGRSLYNPLGPPNLAVFIARDMSESVKAEEDLAASVETTRAVLEAAPDPIIMIDADLNILEASPSTKRTFGLTPAERVGASALDVVLADDRERVEGELRRFFREKRKEPFRIRFGAQHKDGHTLTIEARGLVLSDESGRAPRAVIVSRDISDAVAAEAALADSVALTSAILEAAPDSITTIDNQLRVINSSAGAERLFGIPRADRRGQSVPFIVHPDDQFEYVAALKRLFRLGADNTITMRFRAHHADGTWMRIQTRARLLRNIDGQVPQAVMVSRDVSEEFAAQEAMKNAREAAEQSNLAKSEFMSRMSHELRTPLNSVLGFSQILQMELESPDQLELVEHIFKSGSHLLDLINEVLDISRVESGHINVSLESVSVDDVVDECIRIMTPQASDAGITLVARDCHDAQVLSDQQRLTQVLLNLMSNAVKFNSVHGTVTIECITQGDRVRLNVTDTGAGITPEMVDRLFIAFERLDADAKGIQGTGLGLAHSKSLIEAIGGSVGVESVPGKGSTFWIDVPATDVPRSVAPQPRVRVATTKPALPETTVLYIEDNVSNIHLIERLMLNRTTVHLVTSLQGGMGIELAQQLKPALILLDVHLPDIHGFDVLHRLRDDPRTKDIPVVVLSADATDWQTARFLQAGANDYLTKPIDLRRLLEMLDEYLGAAPSPLVHHDTP
jgi:PAS domain S-box-containing protein